MKKFCVKLEFDVVKWINSDVVFDILVLLLMRRILRKVYNFGVKEIKVNRVGC